MESPILFINACVRKESRTRVLADQLLLKLNRPFEEIRLNDLEFPVVDEDFLKLRDQLISEKAFDHPIFAPAQQFARAESIVIAAPYWDLSFPACLKQYFEQINVLGITFEYSAEGLPVPKCNADKLYYVTTAGGAFVPEEFGFGYVKALAQGFYGINDVRLIMASGLDIDGADAGEILGKAIDSVKYDE
jgi:FMN-dependent NADH-azoreductase